MGKKTHEKGKNRKKLRNYILKLTLQIWGLFSNIMTTILKIEFQKFNLRETQCKNEYFYCFTEPEKVLGKLPGCYVRYVSLTYKSKLEFAA